MTPTLIELVIAEALSRALRIERVPMRSRRNRFYKRLLLIEGQRCQVIPAPCAKHPHGEYFPLYLPRTDWAGLLIYVTLTETRPVFNIIPRAIMSKDTGWTYDSLQPYREAWESFKQTVLPASRKFETLSWQLRAVATSARLAGLEVQFIKTKKKQEGRRWPPIVKRRLLIGGRRCAICSATRLEPHPDNQRYNYVIIKTSSEVWPEFQLHAVKNSGSLCDVFVIPRRLITGTIAASLDNPKLAPYKNAWNLLTASAESLASIGPIERKKRIPPPPPPLTKHFEMLQQTIRAAESRGLHTKSAQNEGITHGKRQIFLYVADKRCQVIQASVAVHRPTSNWPEFIIVHSGSEKGKSYVIPLEALAKQSQRSVKATWIKQFEDAWNLLVES
jgi:hypothetical protein